MTATLSLFYGTHYFRVHVSYLITAANTQRTSRNPVCCAIKYVVYNTPGHYAISKQCCFQKCALAWTTTVLNFVMRLSVLIGFSNVILVRDICMFQILNIFYVLQLQLIFQEFIFSIAILRSKHVVYLQVRHYRFRVQIYIMKGRAETTINSPRTLTY